MIYYLSTRAHHHTLSNFLGYWGQALAARVTLVAYEDVLPGGDVGARAGAFMDAVARRGVFDRLGAEMQQTLRSWLGPWLRWSDGNDHDADRPMAVPAALAPSPHAAYVFADLERLGPAALEQAAALWIALGAVEPAVRRYNHPLRVQRRYELLRTLRRRGVNDFDVYRLTEGRTPERFPVFIRREDDHAGPETALIFSVEDLAAAVDRLTAEGHTREGRIVTELAAAPDDEGLYRKYAAWLVGDEIVPGHLFAGESWMLKEPEILNTEIVQEEQQYLEANPHAEVLRDVFRIAAIDYGRVDYGIVDGRVQIYEINTNPGIPSGRPPRPHAVRTELEARTSRALAEALGRLDGGEG